MLIADQINHLAGPRQGATRPGRDWVILVVSVLAGALLLLPAVAPAGASGRQVPFLAGERLTYQLRWQMVPAGTAVLEVLPGASFQGQPAHHFRMTATSNKVLDLFYKVRDKVDSIVNIDMTHSLFYKKDQQEGRARRDIKVFFDWSEKVARYSNFDKDHRTSPLMEGSFDPMSGFYYVRSLDLREGMEISRPISDGNKNVIGIVWVRKRETITVAGREYDTFLIEPDLKHVGGVFEKSKDAKLKIWVTADAAKIPVRIKSKVVVGSFIADLVDSRTVPVLLARDNNGNRVTDAE
ncbi:MAG: DUF3108 domain-containing protein [Desulfobacterales bacterium]|nr:DUF3108 domain-containing protein [Desulfobacterales bacterium]